jgi:hypothetical protein
MYPSLKLESSEKIVHTPDGFLSVTAGVHRNSRPETIPWAPTDMEWYLVSN